MKSLATALSRKEDIPVSRLHSLMSDMTIELCTAMTGLYDMGVSESPYAVDEFTVHECIFEMCTKAEKSLFVDCLSGKSVFTAERLEYVLLYVKDELKKVCELYKKYLHAKDVLEVTNKVIEAYKAHKSKVSFRVRFVSAEGIYVRTRQRLVPELFLKSGQVVKTVSLGECTLHALCDDIGVPYVVDDEPLFMSGITREEESSLVDMIVAGSVELDGRYGKQLRERIESYYLEGYSKNTGQMGVFNYSWIIYTKADKYKSTVVKELSLDSAIFLSSNKVYYAVAKEDGIEDIPEYVGGGCTLDGETIVPIDMFYGVQGNFTTERTSDWDVPCYLIDYGIVYLMLTDYSGKEIPVYSEGLLEVVSCAHRGDYSKSVDIAIEDEYYECAREASELLGEVCNL